MARADLWKTVSGKSLRSRAQLTLLILGILSVVALVLLHEEDRQVISWSVWSVKKVGEEAFPSKEENVVRKLVLEFFSASSERPNLDMIIAPKAPVTHVWPTPEFTLPGHPRTPDRPHKVSITSSSYALEELDTRLENPDTTPVRVLTFQKWADNDEKDREYSVLSHKELIEMRWQCLLCFTDPHPFSDGVHIQAARWEKVRVNGTGKGTPGHPHRLTMQPELDLTCARFDVTSITHYKVAYNGRFNGELEDIVMNCEVPSKVLRSSQQQKPGAGVHGWLTLVQADWSREEVNAHFQAGAPQPSLTNFVGLEDLTRHGGMALPIGKTPNLFCTL